MPFLSTGVANSRPREAQSKLIWTNYTLFESGRLILHVGKNRKSARPKLTEKKPDIAPPPCLVCHAISAVCRPMCPSLALDLLILDPGKASPNGSGQTIYYSRADDKSYTLEKTASLYDQSLQRKSRIYPPVWSVTLFRPYAGQCALP